MDQMNDIDYGDDLTEQFDMTSKRQVKAMFSDFKPGIRQKNWHKVNEDLLLPKDGSIIDVVIAEDETGIGLTCGVVKEGRIILLPNMDITDSVLWWHKVPGIICDTANRRVTWDDEGEE